MRTSLACFLFSSSALSDSSATPWTVASKPLCPWDPPGRNTGAAAVLVLVPRVSPTADVAPAAHQALSFPEAQLHSCQTLGRWPAF